MSIAAFLVKARFVWRKSSRTGEREEKEEEEVAETEGG